MFRIYINDKPDVLNNDDVQLYRSTYIENIRLIIDWINNDFRKVDNWAKVNGLGINPSKSKSFIALQN